MVYPKACPTQHDLEVVNAKVDIDGEGFYHKWELYEIHEEEVNEEEAVKIRARMLYVLSGDKKHLRELQAEGGKQSEGKKPWKRASNLYKRKDHSKTQKRRKGEVSKTRLDGSKIDETKEI